MVIYEVYNDSFGEGGIVGWVLQIDKELKLFCKLCY